MRVVLILLGGALLSLASGCADVPTDETPSGAVRMFVAAMERSEAEPEALREAYALLSASSRRGLVQRSHLAASLGGRELPPWEMLVRGRFRRSFPFRESASAMREAIDGDSATVTVRSEDGERTAVVPLVREDGRWRIVVDIPPPREASGATPRPAPPE
ncbi:MAG: hypothetical protein KF729_23385 [Sandaracinaceae bacterium]|nr:hypothetical protein [Sandaracinaceae bacterium]